MTDDHSHEDYQAAAAAKGVESAPDVVFEGTPLGECYDCGAEFDYGAGTDHENFDPCPDCGSQNWGKWGYRHDGEEIPREDVEWGGE